MYRIGKILFLLALSGLATWPLLTWDTQAAAENQPKKVFQKTNQIIDQQKKQMIQQKEKQDEQRQLEVTVAEGLARHPVLECIKHAESGGDYTIVGDLHIVINGAPSHSYGAYQFQQKTWDATVIRGGKPELAGQRPNTIAPLLQDWAAITLADIQGGYRDWSTYNNGLCPAKKPVPTTAPPAVTAPATPSNVWGGNEPNWDWVAQCETGGNWAMKGPRFSGGLGFANTTWTAYNKFGFPANAGDATREQQIQVAQTIHFTGGCWGPGRDH